MDRPTKDHIYSLYRMAAEYSAVLHANMLKCQEYERLENARYVKGMLEGYDIKIPPTAPVAVQTLVDHVLLGERPEITVLFPPGVHRRTTKEEKHIEELQGWLDEETVESDYDAMEATRRDFVSQTANPGMGVYSYAIDWRRWPEQPKKGGVTAAEYKKRLRQWEKTRAYANPFQDRSVNPLNVYFDPVHPDDPDWVIEVTQRKLMEYGEYAVALEGSKPSETAEKRPSWRTPDGGLLTIEVEELIFVSKDWWAKYANQVNLLGDNEDADDEGVAPNPEGLIWYQRAIAGLGKNDQENRPEYKIKPLLLDALPTLDMEAEAVNQANQIRGTMAGGAWTARDETAEVAKEKFGQNPVTIPGITYMDKEQVLEALVLPTINPAVFQTLEIIRNYVDLSLGASILRGIGTTGDAAAKYRTMLAEARLKFQATRESCQQAEEKMRLDKLQMIKNHAEEFKGGLTRLGRVQGKLTFLTLKPDHIPDGIAIRVKYNPITPEERGFKMEMGMKLLQAGPNGSPAIDEEMFLRDYAGVKNPKEVLKNKAKDFIIRKLLEVAAAAASEVAVQRLQQKLPGLFQSLMTQPPPVAQPGAQGQGSVATAQPGGFVQPGEQPVAPPTGSPQDMMAASRGAIGMPMEAGVR